MANETWGGSSFLDDELQMQRLQDISSGANAMTPAQPAQPAQPGSNAGTAAAVNLAQGGSAGDALTTYGAASGQPMLIAAGLAVKTLEQRNKNKMTDKMNRYKAALEAQQQRQQALGQMSDNSATLGKALG